MRSIEKLYIEITDELYSDTLNCPKHGRKFLHCFMSAY